MSMEISMSPAKTTDNGINFRRVFRIQQRQHRHRQRQREHSET